MPAKFCCETDCYEPAIGAARSRDHCRGHYNTLILAAADDLIAFEVTATNGIKVTDCRTQVGIGPRGVATLDPRETNVAALVAAGIGKVVPPAKPAGGKAADKA